MCELILNWKFNFIIFVFDLINYIIEDDDLIRYFEKVYEYLKDEGLFIFDINLYYKLFNILGNNIYIYSLEDIFYIWENFFEDNILSMFLIFFVK